MKVYTHLFFDLDHTLWDLERNAFESIRELFTTYRLNEMGISSVETFYAVYTEVNAFMWEQLRMRKIEKESLRYQRFQHTFVKFGIDQNENLYRKLADDFGRITPYKSHLFPGALEVLNVLQEKYELHIITNGFKESQHVKMHASGIAGFFKNVFISEEIGYHKPEKEIFQHALQVANTTAHASLMIGDNMEADILGAKKSGIDTVWFNSIGATHHEIPTYEISNLKELLRFL